MPQENQVLRCYSCKIFQVHLIKKVKKWQCKICNSKQSVIHVYGKGSGKDCRLHVMKLNELQYSGSHIDNVNECETSVREIITKSPVTERQNIRTKNKWSDYVDEKLQESDESEENIETLEEVTKKKRNKKLRMMNKDLSERDGVGLYENSEEMDIERQEMLINKSDKYEIQDVWQNHIDSSCKSRGIQILDGDGRKWSPGFGQVGSGKLEIGKKQASFSYENEKTFPNNNTAALERVVPEQETMPMSKYKDLTFDMSPKESKYSKYMVADECEACPLQKFQDKKLSIFKNLDQVDLDEILNF